MGTPLTIIIIVLLLFLVFLSAFFSAAETAYSSVSRSTISRNLKKGKKSAMLIEKHHKSFGWVLSTILISNNLVNILSTSVVSWLLSSFITSSGTVTIVSTAVMTPIIVIFGEIIPKLLAKKYSYGYLVKIVYVMEVLNWIFLPFTFFIKKLTLQTKVTNTENDLKTFITIASEEGVLEKREATLANNALDLDSKNLKGIFVPLDKVVVVKDTDSLIKVKEVFKKSGHSRLPVSRNGVLIGTILLKDIIFSKKSLKELIVPAHVMTVSTNAIKALEQIRINSTHMVFVSNKGGKIIGIMTLEDIIEELVGEIYDEHDKTTPIKQVSLHKYYTFKEAKIINLGKELSISFTGAKENQTVKQWLSERMTRSFKKGISYTYKNSIKFTVVENNKKTGAKIEVIQK